MTNFQFGLNALVAASAALRLCDFALKGLSYPWNPRNPRFSSFGCGFAALCSLWLIHLRLRLAALGLSCPPKLQRRRMRPFAENKCKLLSINNLRQQTAFPVQGQSSLIKVNQGVSYALCVNAAPKSMAANLSYFELIPLNSTYFHFAPPPGGAGTATISPTGQTRSNPVKPQELGLTRSDPLTEIRRFLSVPSVKPVRRRPGEGGSAVRFLWWQWPPEKGPDQ